MAIENPKEGLDLYPLHKLIGLIDSENDLKQAIPELIDSGFEEKDIHYYHGDEGLDVLDLYQTHHGLLKKLLRKIQIVSTREAEEGIRKVYESMNKGSYFITIHAELTEKKDKALQIFRKNNAYNIHYFHTLDIEIL